MNSLIRTWSTVRTIWLYRHEPENLRKLADAYWWALLISAALVFLGLVVFSGVKFYELFDEGEDSTLLSSGGGIMLNLDDLRSTLETFDTRKAQYEFFKKNLPKISDPSR